MCRAVRPAIPDRIKGFASSAHRILTKIEIPLGFLARRFCLAQPSHRGLELQLAQFEANDSGTRRKFSALQSRGGDGFSPSSRARSLGFVDGAASSACRRLRNLVASSAIVQKLSSG
jgi:hypothetical protein